MKNIISILFLITLTININAQYSVSSYPATKRTPTVDDYYGTKITDNYRWLENMQDPDVQQWFKNQGDYSQNIIDKIPGRDSVVTTNSFTLIH